MGSLIPFAPSRRRPTASCLSTYERLELPSLEDFEGFLAELEEERWFARGRGDLRELREVSAIIRETESFRALVVRRAGLRVLRGGRRG